MSDEEKTTDSELIEQAKAIAKRISDAEICAEGDIDEAADLLLTLADRLAELTRLEPWRSPSEPPTANCLAWAKHADGRVYEVYYFADGGGFLPIQGVTGWKPIVRPEP